MGQGLENVQDLEDIKTTKEDIFKAWKLNNSYWLHTLYVSLDRQFSDAKKKGLNPIHLLRGLEWSFMFAQLPFYGEKYIEDKMNGVRKHVYEDMWLAKFKVEGKPATCYDIIIVECGDGRQNTCVH